MSEDRSGQGKVVSSSEVKEQMGRSSFQRVAKDHVGTRSNPTEWAASRRLEKGISSSQGPTPLEKKMVFENNPASVRTLKASGMSDEDIYEALKDRSD